MKTLTSVATVLAMLALSAPAFADKPQKSPASSESPTPIVGKAPIDSQGHDLPLEPARALGLYDIAELGAVDKAAERAIATVEEKCMSNPMSREGMSEAQTKRCNAAVAVLVKQGAKAAPTIFAKLDAKDDNLPYYARNRLYAALGKMGDAKVEDVLLRGYARVASKEIDDYSNDIFMIEAALVSINGVDPVGAEAIGKPEVTDQWREAESAVITWRLFQRDHAGQDKQSLKKDELSRARLDATDKDPKKAYAALSTLTELVPQEALDIIEARVDNDDDSVDKQPFYRLMTTAEENGARFKPETAAAPAPPKQTAPKKTAHKHHKSSKKKH